MASVYRMGDGQLFCARHFAEQFPDMKEPETGWTTGKCVACEASKAAAALGRRGGKANTEAQNAARAENGKKPPKPGSRPRGRPRKEKP